MRGAVQSTHRSNLTSLVDPTQAQTPQSKDKKKQQTAHLYICSFFDRQTETDVTETIKSIIRMDEEQCARRNALRFLIESDPDYFEFESKRQIYCCFSQFLFLSFQVICFLRMVS